MWKLVYASVQGTSNRRLKHPCQDHAFGTFVRTRRGTVLAAACSDGAGAAGASAAGSRVACESILRRVYQAIRSGLKVEKIDKPTMTRWYEEVRKALVAEARDRGVHTHECSCTLLTAVADERSAVFAQVGDGAIVTLEEGAYRPVFWPQSGPHAHTTNFVTDPGLAGHLDFAARGDSVQELALLTDGLQHLALNFTTKKVRPAFFEKLFAPVRRTVEPDSLTLPLRGFLGSAAVNRRTNDDKTLVLASRLA